LEKISTAFNIMGYSILGSAVLTLLISVKGHRSLLGGEDSEANKAAWQKLGSATLAVPGDKGFDEEAEEAKA
jgi:hypothetical protein